MTDAPTRIDKWLWAARFFKTRSLARAAVDAGRVHLNGARVKSSRALKIGDALQITKGLERFDITIDELSNRRGSATIAQGLYTEADASSERRRAEAEQRKLTRAARAGPVKRPDKRARRQIKQFKEGTD